MAYNEVKYFPMKNIFTEMDNRAVYFCVCRIFEIFWKINFIFLMVDSSFDVGAICE